MKDLPLKIYTVSIINTIDCDADVWNSTFSSSKKALDFKIKTEKWIEKHDLTGTLKVDMDSGRLDDESYLEMLEEEYGEDENSEQSLQDLAYTEAWGDVINFLRSQSEAWFLSCGRVKSDVLRDGILIDKIVSEHLRCVNNYGNDREWSVQDACIVDPRNQKRIKQTFIVEDSVNNKEKVEHLAEFIVVNFHHCPIDENVIIEDCICWREDNCKSCLLKNAEHIKIRSE